ncbi:lantibiotic dehydratase [Streptomyces sp. KD18]|uniref:lantibiotic dehydratase n=3 Tax=Streptomyces TaxID=1883 RepID=UPI00168B3F0B|nr:lantibiotic dehydratase [Streptomyces sp. KD18]MBD3579858.1 lantibiotic dehydratase [Streptomyces sp. KD18]
MPHPAQTAPPRAAAARADRPLPEPPALTAPYALVRTTVTPHPADSEASSRVRALLGGLARIAAQEEELRAGLCDDLFASRPGHSEAFHRQVVLPLRRALHNGRAPRPALLARLGDLPVRVPRLGTWLALREERAALLAEADDAVPAALAAERSALAEVCRSPGFTRAVALSSTDLLRAVSRAARDEGGRRARKEEPSVLRHALRATAKTSPLSWYTAVGWYGQGPGAGTPALRAVVRENRAPVAALVCALLDEPRRRGTLAHRLTSSARPTGDGRVRYMRDTTVFAGGRYLVTREEEIEVAAHPALAVLDGLAVQPAPPDALAARLAAALGRPEADPAVRRFLGQLAENGLLVPVDPVDPQHPQPLRALAGWLRRWPEDAALADRIDLLAADTARFAHTPAAERPALLGDLAERWRDLLADTGRPVPAGAAPLNVLSEDVLAAGGPHAPRPAPACAPAAPEAAPAVGRGPVSDRPDRAAARRPAAADPAAGAAPAPAAALSAGDRTALAELTAFAELFDLGHLMRRAAVRRFTARYGTGGTCPAPWEFAADTAASWEDASRLAARPADDPALPPGAAELMRLRAEFARLARAAAAASGGSEGPPEEIVLPAAEVRGLAARLPGWTAARPLGYAWFVQHAVEPPPADAAGAMLCVNHVYAGWGRFTSRFLEGLPPAAARAVAREIRRGLGYGARAAQIRPVGGFNANLHPLLVDAEIGPDRHHGTIAESDVDLVHDPASDQLRLRLRATGELLDVLYLGFLAPVMLPQRLAPFLCDHPEGVVDFRPLLPRTASPAPGGEVVRTPRLRHRHVVLARRRWHLPEGVLAALRTDLADDPGDVPAAAVARWRALLGLPEQLFLHPVPQPPAGRAAEDFLASLRAPKPQPLDLGSALHLRCLPGWLARHPRGVVLEEALPGFGGRDRPARAVELVAETHRPARTG